MASVGRSVRPIENLEGASLSVPTKFVQIDKSADGDFSPARIARRWSPLAAVGPVLLPTDALPSDRSRIGGGPCRRVRDRSPAGRRVRARLPAAARVLQRGCLVGARHELVLGASGHAPLPRPDLAVVRDRWLSLRLSAGRRRAASGAGSAARGRSASSSGTSRASGPARRPRLRDPVSRSAAPPDVSRLGHHLSAPALPSPQGQAVAVVVACGDGDIELAAQSPVPEEMFGRGPSRAPLGGAGAMRDKRRPQNVGGPAPPGEHAIVGPPTPVLPGLEHRPDRSGRHSSLRAWVSRMARYGAAAPRADRD